MITSLEGKLGTFAKKSQLIRARVNLQLFKVQELYFRNEALT